MIRKLTADDRAATLALLGQAPEMNLYLLGNIEAIGFDADFCEFFGDFAEDGELRGVLNRYFTGWALYGAPHADWAEIARVIDGLAESARLQDNPGGIPSILPFLKRHQVERIEVEELMRLAAEDFAPQPAPEGVTVRRATLADKQALVEVYREAGNMHRSEAGVERPLRDATVMVAERDGRIVSVALTNAETSTLAMIGGVYTPPEARGSGLARAVVGALCAHLLEQGKTPCLYWANPSAGKVYRTLGFKPIGTWRAVTFAGH